ncbi:tRNA (guanosine(46)-N7)-methyltransferase TrmB [Nocardia nova]|uniref:tRNA (guanosine(46)-N7)-methyltransferase TrmB n=1 Tax=Nocardia nova TaxID=37330 RepID=UPI0033F2E0B8
MDAVNDAAKHTAGSDGAGGGSLHNHEGPRVRREDSAGSDGAEGSTLDPVAPERESARLYPRVTSFRSRRGALTATQQQSWERMWPRIGRDVGDELLDAAAWFGRTAPLIIEIGCGTGTATAAMAQAEPDFDLIGIEVYKPGLAQLVQRIEREGIDNVRLLRGDAVDVLEHMIAKDSLAGVRVFFPDPWPKARHHKRRLLQPATMSLIASRLQRGGILHVATDHAGYAEHIAEVGAGEPQLVGLNEATGGDPEHPATDTVIGLERPVTKFESKAHRAGSAITEFIWGRI